MTLCGCFAGLALSAAELLRPDERTGKMLRTVFSLVFILIFVSPVLSAVNDTADIMTFSQPGLITQEETEAAVEEDIVRYSSDAVSESLGEMLKNRNIPFSEISADVNIDEGRSISISKIYIASGKFEEAREAVKEAVGNDVEILRCGYEETYR